MQDDGSHDRSVWKVAAIVFAMIAVGVCVYSYLLYGALASELATERTAVRVAHDEVENLNTQLRLMEEQAAAQVQGEHALPAAQSGRNLPIDLTFHDASRSGKVAVLHNLSDADIEVTLEVQSPALHSDVRRPLVINARGMLRIGPAEGWRFAPGQIVSLNKDKYRSLIRIVS